MGSWPYSRRGHRPRALASCAARVRRGRRRRHRSRDIVRTYLLPWAPLQSSCRSIWYKRMFKPLSHADNCRTIRGQSSSIVDVFGTPFRFRSAHRMHQIERRLETPPSQHVPWTECGVRAGGIAHPGGPRDLWEPTRTLVACRDGEGCRWAGASQELYRPRRLLPPESGPRDRRGLAPRVVLANQRTEEFKATWGPEHRSTHSKG